MFSQLASLITSSPMTWLVLVLCFSDSGEAQTADICSTPERQPWFIEDNGSYLTQTFNSNWTFSEDLIVESFRSKQEETLSILNQQRIADDANFGGFSDTVTSTSNVEWMPFVITSDDLGLKFEVAVCASEARDPRPQCHIYYANSIAGEDGRDCGDLTRLDSRQIDVENSKFSNFAATADPTSPPCATYTFLSKRNHRYALQVRGSGNYIYTILPSEALVCPKYDDTDSLDGDTDENHLYRSAPVLQEGATTIDFAQAQSFTVSSRSCRYESSEVAYDYREGTVLEKPANLSDFDYYSQREIGLWYRYHAGPDITGNPLAKLSLSSLENTETSPSAMGISMFEEDCESSPSYPLHNCVAYSSEKIFFNVYPNQTYYFLLERNATEFTGAAVLTLEIERLDDPSSGSGSNEKSVHFLHWFPLLLLFCRW